MSLGYDYPNRAEIILSGFTFEPKDDGTCKLVFPNARLKDGSPDWQWFSTFSDMVIWLAAGVDEIKCAGLEAELRLRFATRQTK